MDSYSILLILFLLSHSLQPLSSQDEGTNTTQPICPTSFSCSTVGYLSFPFYASSNSACGLFEVDCNQPVPKIQLQQGYPSYDLVQVMPSSTSSEIVFVRDKYFENQITDKSCDSLLMYRFPPSSSSLSYTVSPNLPVLRCGKSPGLADSYFSAIGEYYVFNACGDYNYYYTYSNGYITSNTNLPPSCSVVVLPGNSPSTLPKETDFNDLFQLLTPELNLVVQVSDSCQECHSRGGQCSNRNQEFWCYYSSRNTKKEKPRNIVIKSALATIAVGTAIILILTILCFRFKIFSRRDEEKYSNLEAIIKTHESLAPKRYSYSHVKKMTNTFKVKVGEGGFGSVYRGKLQNGNDVAVKVLNELKGSGEDLVNELASISKTSHVNIVSLLGFCFEGRHRALIYEYMPNGSLEKFIYNPSSTTSNQLEWKKLYDITIGIGRGLEYLHRGCNTRILHFDIKPHNILLDKDLCPKISDFGLAKLCPETRSVVSMSGMRGTPGYIAPEVFSRNFGAVSHKSDVYSYGMMVLEMVRGRSNVVVEENGTSSMYFFDSVYKQVIANKNLGLSGVLDVQDTEVAKKMILVSLWCTQSDPSCRPSMSKVLDMLEGDLESIQIPVANKSSGKHSKQVSPSSDAQKEEYIHVRARRGQATNSHSLAERVRREKISERMKFLQDLVPGCSKVTGKAVMLDEIINYVQSLQRQVEFLSMKLATVNPRTDINLEGLMAKDAIESRLGPSGSLSADMAMPYTLNQSQMAIMQGGISGVGRSSDADRRTLTSHLMSISGGFKDPASHVPSTWDDELHNIVQMGLNPSTPISNQNLGSTPPGHLKAEP